MKRLALIAILVGGALVPAGAQAATIPKLLIEVPSLNRVAAVVKPASFYPDQFGDKAIGFHWSVWSATKAVGTGRVITNCHQTLPMSARCPSVRQTITYTRPRQLCGVLTYTRAHFSGRPHESASLDQLPDTNFCQWYA
jgi:hypothetical protein